MKYNLCTNYKFFGKFTKYVHEIYRTTVMNAHALTLHWHTDMNTLKCIILSAVKHRPTENALRPLTWSICGGPSTGFMRFGWGCQGNGTGWIHGQLMAEMERNLCNYLTQNHHDKNKVYTIIEEYSLGITSNPPTTPVLVSRSPI